MTVQIEGVFQESQDLEHLWGAPDLPQNNYEETRELVQNVYDMKLDPIPVEPTSRGISKTNDPGFDCVDLAGLLFTRSDYVYTPNFGTAVLSTRAKTEIRRVTGLESDKYFEHLPPKEIQDVWEKYFEHLPKHETNIRKVVARSLTPKEKEQHKHADCIIQGFVSPNYFEIPDVVVLEKLEDAVGRTQLQDAKFRARLHNDITVIDILNPQTLALQSENDTGLGGIKIINSAIGAASLKVMSYLVRLACTNGMLVSVPGSNDVLFRKVHREFEFEQLISEFRLVWDNANNIIKRYIGLFPELIEIKFEPEELPEKINIWLRGCPRKQIKLVLEAWNAEPIPNAYGVLQAITKAGTVVRSSVIKMQEFEKMAASYVHRLIGKH